MRDGPSEGMMLGPRIGKGTTAVSTNGATANFKFVLTAGAFWVVPLTYFYLPKSARADLFPQSVKIHCFCSGAISVDPIGPQPSRASGGLAEEKATTKDAPQNMQT